MTTRTFADVDPMSLTKLDQQDPARNGERWLQIFQNSEARGLQGPEYYFDPLDLSRLFLFFLKNGNRDIQDQWAATIKPHVAQLWKSVPRIDFKNLSPARMEEFFMNMLELRQNLKLITKPTFADVGVPLVRATYRKRPNNDYPISFLEWIEIFKNSKNDKSQSPEEYYPLPDLVPLFLTVLDKTTNEEQVYIDETDTRVGEQALWASLITPHVKRIWQNYSPIIVAPKTRQEIANHVMALPQLSPSKQETITDKMVVLSDLTTKERRDLVNALTALRSRLMVERRVRREVIIDDEDDTDDIEFIREKKKDAQPRSVSNANYIDLADETSSESEPEETREIREAVVEDNSSEEEEANMDEDDNDDAGGGGGGGGDNDEEPEESETEQPVIDEAREPEPEPEEEEAEEEDDGPQDNEEQEEPPRSGFLDEPDDAHDEPLVPAEEEVKAEDPDSEMTFVKWSDISQRMSKEPQRGAFVWNEEAKAELLNDLRPLHTDVQKWKTIIEENTNGEDDVAFVKTLKMEATIRLMARFIRESAGDPSFFDFIQPRIKALVQMPMYSAWASEIAPDKNDTFLAMLKATGRVDPDLDEKFNLSTTFETVSDDAWNRLSSGVGRIDLWKWKRIIENSSSRADGSALVDYTSPLAVARLYHDMITSQYPVLQKFAAIPFRTFYGAVEDTDKYRRLNTSEQARLKRLNQATYDRMFQLFPARQQSTSMIDLFGRMKV